MRRASAKLWQITKKSTSATFLQKEFIYLRYGKELFQIVHLAIGNTPKSRTADLKGNQGLVDEKCYQ